MRPFRFLAEARIPRSGAELAAAARRAENLGYHALVVPDHLLGQLSPLVAMTALASATTTLRVAPFVLNNDLRHPAVLAQDLASLDILSGGRLDVAIGAGWNKPEYDAIGLAYDPIAVRQARLAEAVTVLKGCLRGEPFRFSGEHYTITDYAGLPSVQRPHPPLFIGGGSRRTLALAGREADIVGLAPRIHSWVELDVRTLTLESTREKIAWVRSAAGERFAQLELNVYPAGAEVVVTDFVHAEVAKVIDALRARTGVELTEQEVLESPHLFIGSVQALVEKLQWLRAELGISSFMLGERGALGTLQPVLERLSGT